MPGNMPDWIGVWVAAELPDYKKKKKLLYGRERRNILPVFKRIQCTKNYFKYNHFCFPLLTFIYWYLKISLLILHIFEIKKNITDIYIMEKVFFFNLKKRAIMN